MKLFICNKFEHLFSCVCVCVCVCTCVHFIRCLFSSDCDFLFKGDVNSISVGSGTNIQDNSLVHVAKSNLSGKVLPTIIGDNVTVGEQLVITSQMISTWSWCEFHEDFPLRFPIWIWQVTVLSYMDVLLRMRHLLVWVQPYLMGLMLRNMRWLLLEPLLGRTQGSLVERFVNIDFICLKFRIVFLSSYILWSWNCILKYAKEVWPNEFLWWELF